MSNGTGHVPAWKRLGLKLKYAKDDAPAPIVARERTGPIAAPVETNGHKRRKLESPEPVNVPIPASPQIAAADSPKSAAKEKREKRPKKASKEQPTETPVEDAVTPRTSSMAKGRPHRKSVSFADGSKLEDGQSSKDLYAQWTDREQEISEMVAGSLPTALRVVEAEPATIGERGEAVRKPKKAKKSKSTLLTKESPASDGNLTSRNGHSSANTQVSQSALVEYLETYHRSKDTWKFNKARQNQTFKHLFDLDKLPPSVNDALYAYVRGLNSEPVRNRLRERAQAVIDADIKEGLDVDDTMSNYAIDTTVPNAGAVSQASQQSTDEQKLRAAYLFGLKRAKRAAKHVALEVEEEQYQLTDEWAARLAKRLRSEQLMAELGEPAPVSAMTPTRKQEGIDYHIDRHVPTSVTAPDGTITMKRKRKRKRRTGLAMDDSSSDETSSDDEEDDRRLRDKLQAAAKKADSEDAANKIQAQRAQDERVKKEMLTAEWKKNDARASAMAKVFAQGEARGISMSKLLANMENLVDAELASANIKGNTAAKKADETSEESSGDSDDGDTASQDSGETGGEDGEESDESE